MAKKTPPKAKAKPEPENHPTSDICFVIMPFGGWLDKYYEEIYQPAIEAAGLEPHRADDLFRPSTIVNDIWTYTKRAKLMLADLTAKNPNVFYELGLAHALAKPVILVADSMDDIPFDLRALRIITYDKNAPNWGDVLRQKVQSSIGEVLQSPAEAVLPAFLEVKKDGGKTTVTGRELELIEIKQEIDLLRRELRSRYAEERSFRSMSYDQAVSIARAHFARDLPPDAVLERLRMGGVPPQVARDLIMQEMGRRGVKHGATEPPEPGSAIDRTVDENPKT